MMEIQSGTNKITCSEWEVAVAVSGDQKWTLGYLSLVLFHRGRVILRDAAAVDGGHSWWLKGVARMIEG